MIKQRGQIGRSVTITHCEGVCVRSGKVEPFVEDLIGNFNEMKATNALRKRTHDPTITITSVERDTDYYSMSIEGFMKACTDHTKEN